MKLKRQAEPGKTYDVNTSNRKYIETSIFSAQSPIPPFNAESILFIFLFVCLWGFLVVWGGAVCVCFCFGFGFFTFILRAWHFKSWVMKFSISSFGAQSKHQLNQVPQMTVARVFWLSHALSVRMFLWILHTYLSPRTWHRFFGSYFGREWISSKEWEGK